MFEPTPPNPVKCPTKTSVIEVSDPNPSLWGSTRFLDESSDLLTAMPWVGVQQQEFLRKLVEGPIAMRRQVDRLGLSYLIFDISHQTVRGHVINFSRNKCGNRRGHRCECVDCVSLEVEKVSIGMGAFDDRETPVVGRIETPIKIEHEESATGYE